ncbi:hypothetical protein FZEAL_5836 [Fusarium zealandicum]|uniref:Uncharacterized protein n=1 Tax=Fusarium zealandicum TaxID=1053134 RepID=A0A8H4XKG8_9HYPO|nr:hypothetical protein FZEAL_5836 [Fusarium zealandicum]
MSDLLDITTEIRSDHTHWVCKNSQTTIGGNTCDVRNEMSTEECTGCADRRDVGAEAQDISGENIGRLIAVASLGSMYEEYWEYIPRLTNGHLTE